MVKVKLGQAMHEAKKYNLPRDDIAKQGLIAMPAPR